LGTSKEDILVAGRGKGERLYGGAGDDLLISVDGGDYAHGGSGEDIFAFRFNKNIRRSAQRGKTVDHVIEDFNLDEGDSICLSHIVTKSRHKNIDYRGTGQIKGTGIEVRLVQGKQGTAQKEQEAFTGIEDGVEKTIGELPEISKTRRNGVDSRLEVYEDGNLVTNITLKNTPSSRAFSRKLGKAIFGKYSQTSKSVVSAEGANANHLTEFSLTNVGIPFKGNSLKIDSGENSPSNVSALVNSAEANDSAVSAAFDGSIDNSFMKASAHVTTNYYQHFEVFGDIKWDKVQNKFINHWPSYRVGIQPTVSLSINPNIILTTGNVAGYGSLTYTPKLPLSGTVGEEVAPGFDVSATGGIGLNASMTLTTRGLDKKIVISPEASASAYVDFAHDSYYNTPLAVIPKVNKSKASISASTIDYGENNKKDGIVGITGALNLSPFIEFDLGFGYEDVEDGAGITANIIESGPKLSYPLSLSMEEDAIITPGKGVTTYNDIYFNYGPAKIDWITTVPDVSFSDDFQKFEWTGPQYNLKVAEIGPSGSIPIPELSFSEFEFQPWD
jgi:hypothetical protein